MAGSTRSGGAYIGHLVAVVGVESHWHGEITCGIRRPGSDREDMIALKRSRGS